MFIAWAADSERRLTENGERQHRLPPFAQWAAPKGDK
jgi:hypothetical protein